jgi:hypothetical protein
MTLREAAEPSLHEQVAVLLADRDRLQRERDELTLANDQLFAHGERMFQQRDDALALAGRLREALRPFVDAYAEHFKNIREVRRDWYERMPGHFPVELNVTVADCRVARACLAAEEPR